MAKQTLAGLKPNPRNPRTITDKKAKMLRDSLARFGDLSGIVFNRSSGQVVGGHQRIKAFQGLGASNVVISQTYDTPSHAGTVAEGHVDISGERFAYREVQWSDDEEKAANLAANKGAGEWNLDQVAEWVAELADVDFELDLTMFDADERDNLVPDVEQIAEVLPGDDDSAELPAEPIAKMGDLYQLGLHRLMCGDATNVQHCDTLLQHAMPDLVFTDPPYGMNLNTDFDSMFKNDKAHKKTGARHAAVEGDDKDFDATDMLNYFFKVDEIVLWGADYYRASLPSGGSWFCWDKRCDENMDKVVGNVFELAWSKTSHKREVARILWSGHHGMAKDDTKKRVHPTQKPVELVLWFLARLKGRVVCDLFAGSGSTLIACERAGRECRAMEIDPKYVDQIVGRWEAVSGQKAQLLSSGTAEDTDA